MAARYVYHGGSNTSPYDTWAKAATTLATAITGSAAGDDFWVASDHSETQASVLTLSFNSSITSPQRCISVNRAGSTPPVAADILAGATITTTGASGIDIAGCAYIYGVTFNCATGATGASLAISGTPLKLESCALNLVGTGSGNQIQLCSSTQSLTELIDTTMSFGATGQSISSAGSFRWANKPGSTAITGAIVPTTLITNINNLVSFELVGLDLSAAGSGKTLSAGTRVGVNLINCKLGASVTVAGTPSVRGSRGINVIGCSSTTNVSRNERYRYEGTLTTETTIKRTAGASDGTTAYSWKVVTTANAKRTFPFETFEGAVWNSTTGSAKTLTIHTVTDNVTLTDAEIWVEVEYLGSSATPVSTLITDANATVLTTAAWRATTTEAWTTTGLATPVKQKLEVTFTPQMAGPIRWRVKVAKASTTVYICPNADLS